MYESTAKEDPEIELKAKLKGAAPFNSDRDSNLHPHRNGQNDYYPAE